MASYQPVQFTSPGYDYGADISQIERRRQMAMLLQQQGMQPVQEQPVGPGQFAVPTSPWQDAAKLGQIYAGLRQQKKADTQQRELATRAQQEMANVLKSAQSAMTGTPMAEDMSGNITPAVAGDPAKAASIYMQNPMTAQLGMTMQQKLMEEQMHKQKVKDIMDMAAKQSGGFSAGGPWNQQAAAQSGNLFANIPPQALALMLDQDPRLASLGKMVAESGNTSGRVFYDQNNQAYTVDKSGRRIDIAGTKQGISPADRYRIPLEQTRTWWETGQRPSQLGDAAQGVPQPQAPQTQAPTPQVPPAAAPAPQLPPRSTQLTPKQKAELEAARPHQTQAATEVMNTVQNAISEAERLAEQPGLANITGTVAGRTPNLSTAAVNAQANLDTLKSQIGVQALNAMRAASKTGGAVGQVTEKEWPILQNQLGALQQSQSTPEFRKNLKAVVETLKRTQANARQGYESVYGKLNWEPPKKAETPDMQSIVDELKRRGLVK